MERSIVMLCGSQSAGIILITMIHLFVLKIVQFD